MYGTVRSEGWPSLMPTQTPPTPWTLTPRCRVAFTTTRGTCPLTKLRPSTLPMLPRVPTTSGGILGMHPHPLPAGRLGRNSLQCPATMSREVLGMHPLLPPGRGVPGPPLPPTVPRETLGSRPPSNPTLANTPLTNMSSRW